MFSSWKPYVPYTPHTVESQLRHYYTRLSNPEVPHIGDWSVRPSGKGSTIDHDRNMVIKADIDRALSTLDARTRQITMMFCAEYEARAFDWDGHSIIDAAAVGRRWGMTADEVMARVRGAIKRMSRFLEPKGIPQVDDIEASRRIA